MTTKRIKELTQDELEMVIYYFASGCSRFTARRVFESKNLQTPMKERCKLIADGIFNNGEVEI